MLQRIQFNINIQICPVKIFSIVFKIKDLLDSGILKIRITIKGNKILLIFDK